MKILFVLLLLCCICNEGCRNKQKNNNLLYKQLPQPPLPNDEQLLCDSLKMFAHKTLKQSNCILIYNDSIKDYSRYLQFVKVLKEQFHLDYYKTYDINDYKSRAFQFCVEPIMDSFIISKYGYKGKDSIINAAYLIVK